MNKTPYPLACEFNKWSYPFVGGRDPAGPKFLQQEVLHESLPDDIRKLIGQMQEISRDDRKQTSLEVGFFYIALKTGNNAFAFCTSRDPEGISEEDMRTALTKALAQLSRKSDIERVQFYHTHPPGPASLQISQLDVDAATLFQSELATQGINVPFDMHALPYDISFKGFYEQFIAPALGTWDPSAVKLEPDVDVLKVERIPVVPTALRITVPAI